MLKNILSHPIEKKKLKHENIFIYAAYLYFYSETLSPRLKIIGKYITNNITFSKINEKMKCLKTFQKSFVLASKYILASLENILGFFQTLWYCTFSKVYYNLKTFGNL